MSEDELRTKIRTFVASRFPVFRHEKLTDDDSLLDSGVVDSGGVLDLATFIADEMGVELGDDDLTPENFDSISTLTRFVSGKR